MNRNKKCQIVFVSGVLFLLVLISSLTFPVKAIDSSIPNGGHTVYIPVIVKPSTACFFDTFSGTSLNSAWTWIDPLGDSTYDLAQNPGNLRMFTPDGGHDLYPPANFDAPRLLQSMSGNFIAETKVMITPTHNYQGAGLLVWQDENNYIRLERTLVQGIDMLYRIDGVYDAVELPYTNSIAYLRLQRTNNNFATSYSDDGTNWTDISTVNMQASDTLQVGLVLINQWQDNPLFADFDYFELDECSVH